MNLINEMKKLGVTLSNEAIAAKLEDLGVNNDSDLSDEELNELAASMGVGKLAIAAESATVAPTASTRGRGKAGLSKAAQKKAEQALQKNGFNKAIEDARGTAKNVEDFSADLENVTTEYCSDRLAAIPHNIMARVVEEVASSEPANFSGFAHAIRNTSGALNFFTMVSASSEVEG